MIPLPASPDFEVSTIRHAEDTATIAASFRELMGLIRSSKWELPVRKVHEAFLRGGKEEAAPHKKKLPGILFSGTFTKRGAANLVRHSGLICVDLDELGDRVEGIKEQVSSDPHVLAVFRSPTGSGLKVVFRCDPDRPHEHSFVAALQYVEKTFALDVDTACRDVSRICFVSHDPEAFVADDATTLPYPEIPKAHHTPMDLPPIPGAELSPGDDYDLRGDWKALLKNHGWTEEGTHYWTRPDKRNGISASWDIIPGRFYVFSSSTSFEPNKVYKPWHLLAHLEYGGDYARTARELQRRGFGAPAKKQLPILPNPAPEPVGGDDDWESESTPSPPITPQALASKLADLQGRPFIDFQLPMADDPSVLIGDRWLSKGDGAILASTSGMGKSSLSLQMGTHWSIGQGIFGGFQPRRPLKSLIFQSEDGDGDIAEVRVSLEHAMKLTDEQKAQVRSNVIIVTDRIHRGASFITELRRQIAIHKPDIVWINPLLAFIGGDVNEAKEAGLFLREQLNSLNEPAAFAYIIIHHTSKPPRDASNRKWNEVMYEMAGSADLTNWARAVLSLQAADNEGEFNLTLAKRGARAGCTVKVPGTVNPAIKFDQPCTKIGIRHSKERIQVNGRDLRVIHWEMCDKPNESTSGKSPNGRKRVIEFAQFIPVCPVGIDKAAGYNQLLRLFQEIRGSLGKSAFQNILDDAIQNGQMQVDRRNPKQPKYYMNQA